MNTATTKSPVLIVGAGPTGLTMAAELTRHGIPCRIVDRKSGVTDKTKALSVQSRTMEVFEDMGIVDEVLERGRIVSGFSFYTEGKRIFQVASGELDTPYSFNMLYPQFETERSLYSHLNSLGTKVEWNTEILELEQENGQIRVKLARSSGEVSSPGSLVKLQDADRNVESLEPDYLIACDGGRSFCRKALNIKLEGETFDSEFIIADLQLDWANPPMKDEWHGYFTDQGFVMIASLDGKNSWRIVMEVPWDMQDESDTSHYEQPTFEEFQKMFEMLNPIPGLKLTEPNWMSRFRIHRRIIDRFRHGNIFFAGDAAHLHSPAGGQGMNTGIQDAYNLAWKLALVYRQIARPELLDTYNAERYPIVKRQVQTTDAAFKMMLLRHPISRAIRDRLASLLNNIEPVLNRMEQRASMITINYRNSPIADEYRELPLHLGNPIKEIAELGVWRDFGEAPRAGDRAPDFIFNSNGAEKRLFEIIQGTTHKLLMFVGNYDEPDFESDFKQRYSLLEQKYGEAIDPVLIHMNELPFEVPEGISVVQDDDGELHQRYGAHSHCIYLIRPDGYIGYRSQPAKLDLFLEYCDRIFAESAM